MVISYLITASIMCGSILTFIVLELYVQLCCNNPFHPHPNPLLYSVLSANSKYITIAKTFQQFAFKSVWETPQLVFLAGCPGFKESNRLPHSPSPKPLSEQQEKKACFAPAPSPTLCSTRHWWGLWD